jgi:hypothetical protein
MTDKVITIGELRIRRKERAYHDDKTVCHHRNLVSDDEGEILTCEDCQKQVSAYWVAHQVIRNAEDEHRKISDQQERLTHERSLVIHLIAAKKVEEAWRRKMAPCCPHCRVPILPEDGLGRAQVNAEIERQDRAGIVQHPKTKAAMALFHELVDAKEESKE